MNKQIFIGLGTNMGHRKKNLEQAICHISSSIGNVVQTSAVYETPPWGFEAAMPFFNQVVEVESPLLPHPLLQQLLAIETAMGRIRKGTGYSSRIIDLDLLFYGATMLNTPDLVLPHPHIGLRRFVLEPLCNIAPQFLHPVTQQNLKSMLENCPDTSVCTKCSLL